MQRIFCFLFFLAAAGSLVAQNGPDTIPPYKRFPTVAPFKLLEVDSVSIFSKADLKKNKSVLIIVFSPDCDHCQHETEEIIKHMDELEKVQIVMATMSPFKEMKDFYIKYKLEEFKNIKVGKDFQYVLPSFYNVHNLPFLAMYNKKGELLTTFDGTMKIEDLIKVFN